MKKTIFILLLAIGAFCFASCKSTPKDAQQTETEEVTPAETEEAVPAETEEADTAAVVVEEEEGEGEGEDM